MSASNFSPESPNVKLQITPLTTKVDGKDVFAVCANNPSRGPDYFMFN